MLIDLLSTGNYVSYNVKLANIIGLNPAIYVSELLSINTKAIKKNKIENNYFRLDREYLQSRTTFDEKTQLEIEDILISAGILEKSETEKDLLFLNITTLTTILMSEDEKLVDTLTSLIKVNTKKNKRTKRECIRDNLKQYITCENKELKEAYEGWVDGVFANPKGFLSKRSIEVFQKTVDEFANHDLDKALAVIDIAAVNGYRDCTWAINVYNKNYNCPVILPQPNKIKANQANISEEIF
jgi:hypothetical protein